MGTENTELTLEEKIIEIDKSFEGEAAPEKEDANPIVAEEKPAETLEMEPKEETEEVTEEPKIEEYTPDLTYRVYDQEKTFDEKVAAFIKSKEDEDFFRDLYTKAAGIEVIKPKLEKYRDEATSYRSKVADYETKMKDRDMQWDYFNQLVTQGSTGNADSVHNLLDALKIPDHIIGEVVAQRLEMSPQERKARNDIATAQYQQNQASAQQNQYQRKLEDVETLRAEFEFEKSLNAASDLNPIINFIDTSLGSGTFREEVINLGVKLEDQAEKEKKPIPTHREVFELVANKYKQFMPAQTTAAPTPEANKQAAPAITKRNVVKGQGALPNLGAGSMESPSGKSFLSIADIEKERDEHFGRKLG